jgi:hypothetical protein
VLKNTVCLYTYVRVCVKVLVDNCGVRLHYADNITPPTTIPDPAGSCDAPRPIRYGCTIELTNQMLCSESQSCSKYLYLKYKYLGPKYKYFGAKYKYFGPKYNYK